MIFKMMALVLRTVQIDSFLLDGDRVSRRDIIVEYNGNAPLQIRQEVWLAFVHTNANRLLGDRRAQRLLRDGQTQEQMALAREEL